MTAGPIVNAGVGDILSPSQVKTFLACPARWMFRHLLGLKTSIQPRAVELSVSGRIGGVPVSGFVDLLDVEGRIIDCKTAARRPNTVSQDYGLQLTSYAMLAPGASGQCRLDTLTKTKTVQLVQLDYAAGRRSGATSK